MSSSFFACVEAVLVAVMDGADGPGTPLASQCTARTECVGKVCYSTTASCVRARQLHQKSHSQASTRAFGCRAKHAAREDGRERVDVARSPLSRVSDSSPDESLAW